MISELIRIENTKTFPLSQLIGKKREDILPVLKGSVIEGSYLRCEAAEYYKIVIKDNNLWGRDVVDLIAFTEAGLNPIQRFGDNYRFNIVNDEKILRNWSAMPEAAVRPEVDIDASAQEVEKIRIAAAYQKAFLTPFWDQFAQNHSRRFADAIREHAGSSIRLEVIWRKDQGGQKELLDRDCTLKLGAKKDNRVDNLAAFMALISLDDDTRNVIASSDLARIKGAKPKFTVPDMPIMVLRHQQDYLSMPFFNQIEQIIKPTGKKIFGLI